MNQNKSQTMDAAEKLMLDLMEKHPGASESLAAVPIPKRRKGKTRGVASNRWPFYEAQLTTAILQRAADGPYPGCPLMALFGHLTRTDECPLSGVKRT